MTVSTDVSQPYTTAEVAALLRISKGSVRNLGKRGVLVPIPTGLRLERWRPDEVNRLLAGKPPIADD